MKKFLRADGAHVRKIGPAAEGDARVGSHLHEVTPAVVAEHREGAPEAAARFGFDEIAAADFGRADRLAWLEGPLGRQRRGASDEAHLVGCDPFFRHAARLVGENNVAVAEVTRDARRQPASVIVFHGRAECGRTAVRIGRGAAKRFRVGLRAADRADEIEREKVVVFSVVPLVAVVHEIGEALDVQHHPGHPATGPRDFHAVTDPERAHASDGGLRRPDRRRGGRNFFRRGGAGRREGQQKSAGGEQAEKSHWGKGTTVGCTVDGPMCHGCNAAERAAKR